MSNQIVNANGKRQKAWIEQIHIIYSGLIAASLIMLQPFLFRGEASGVLSNLCVLSFSIAIPLLAALSLLNYEEDYRNRIVYSPIIGSVRFIAQTAAFVGFVAGFWHINTWAGICVLISGVIGSATYGYGYRKLHNSRQK